MPPVVCHYDQPTESVRLQTALSKRTFYCGNTPFICNVWGECKLLLLFCRRRRRRCCCCCCCCCCSGSVNELQYTQLKTGAYIFNNFVSQYLKFWVGSVRYNLQTYRTLFGTDYRHIGHCSVQTTDIKDTVRYSLQTYRTLIVRVYRPIGLSSVQSADL